MDIWKKLLRIYETQKQQIYPRKRKGSPRRIDAFTRGKLGVARITEDHESKSTRFAHGHRTVGHQSQEKYVDRTP